MGSSKKHKKHKSERRDKYEEYSNNQDPAHLQRGLKLILKVGSNNTPEYNGNSPHTLGPPTAAEAMMSDGPSSPIVLEEQHAQEEYRGERHKKSKKKKKKKDREKKHKHHKEKKHRSERHERHNGSKEGKELLADEEETVNDMETSHEILNDGVAAPAIPPSITNHRSVPSLDADSSQDAFSFMDDDNSQPLPENILFYAGITTDNSPSCRPVSKPIVAKKIEDILIDSPASSSLQSSSLGLGGLASSPTKPLPDLMIPSPSPSLSASTPGGASSQAALTPKHSLEAPKTPSSCSESGREPRSCVLKLKQQKSPLNKLLDHLLRFLEKRDPHQFFAWPVTDDIAPGYSSIINKPMDFSTMRQKIDDSDYATLTEFTEDFKLMCDNAIKYNHVDTVYHKAAKRLLQVGMKYLTPENLMRSLKPLSGYMRELTTKELGFELLAGELAAYESGVHDSADECASSANEEPTQAQLDEEEKRRAIRQENEPKTRFEPYVDDLTAEEVLAQVTKAAELAKKRLTAKQRAHNMGFLRQNKDGTTSLNLLIKDENEGPEKVVSLGDLVGKLKTGSNQLQGLREDKRNDAHLVKPLYYGPFSSFAPVFDSRFSNLSKDETQLVLRTYGDVTAAEYAESILQFTKDSSYATQLANGLLDILTNGEHSKGLEELYDLQVQNYEEKEILKCFNNDVPPPVAYGESREQIEEEYEKFKNTRIDFNKLRTLHELGIDISFLDGVESEMKNYELSRRLQEHLSNNLNLIEKLRATQHERLSQPLPQHLALVQQPGADETHLAHQISQHLTDVAKKLPPSAISDPYSLRKAMGMSYAGLPPPPLPAQRLPVPEILQPAVAIPQLNLSALTNDNPASVNVMPMDIDDDVVGGSSAGVVDLETELREFLESGSGLHATPSAEDNNLVAQLLLN